MDKIKLKNIIKEALAENKKQKLSESTIREIIREVLAEKDNINEEAYDIVRDVTQALNTSRPSQDAVEDYLGRSLSSDELRAFGFNSGMVTGYKYGQPQYAGQGQKKTYTKYARSNSRRSY
jgi:histone H3/H4